MTSAETINEKDSPALVRGSECRALAEFVTDNRGDLVDINYYCLDCGDYPEALQWPAYDWPSDYDCHCATCGVLINKST